MRRIATIGVYGFTAATFVEALRGAGVAVLLDVRQRRGVRGSEYAWANAGRLQALLADADIEYRHHRELAPTTALRQLQYREDAKVGVGKRSRAQLARGFVDGYVAQVLDEIDLAELLAELPAEGVTALLCVERDPEACHRSLIADRMAAEHGALVVHLRPIS